MESVLNYIVESSVGLGVLIVLYRLLLRRRENLVFARFYIIFSMLFSTLLPFLSLSTQGVVVDNVMPELVVGGQGSYLLDTISVYSGRANQSILVFLEKFSWMQLIYLVGIILLTFRVFYGLFRLRLFTRKAKVQKCEQYTLVDTPIELEPFSFFRFLFINATMYKGLEFKTIIKHELAHIQLKHSIDNLFLEFILIVQWFNPFAWLLRRDLKEIQEFQADRYTLESGINQRFYKELLLSNAMGTRFAFGNNFNQSLIKKRLKMMNNKINKSIGFVRVSILTLTVSLLFILFACEQKSNGEKIFVQKDEISEPTTSSMDNVYNLVDEMPEFPGGMDGVREFIAKNLQYPKRAVEEGINGRVFVSFVVSDKGKVTDAAIERGIDTELDAEALRVINLLPDWTPGRKDGKEVNVRFTLPIIFSLDNHPDEDVFVIVEDMPEFPGGMDGMRDYIRKNIMYPDEAKNANVTGKALVNFVVDKTGKVTHVKIKKSSDNEFLDKEAIRVVESMPDWKPGSQRGQNVNVQFIIPIEFIMTDKGGAIVVKKSEYEKEKMNVDVKFVNDNNKLKALGTVKDEANKPLQGVSIVIKGSTSGTLSDKNGNFSIPLKTKSQELVFSYVGKETVIIHQ
jgi:TonB family protein